MGCTIEKSDQQIEEQYNELTEVYKEIDTDQIELTRIGVDMDGSKFDAKYIWPKQGGIVKGADKDILLVELLVAPNEWYAIWYIEGEQVQYIHKIISKDGKTMYQTFEGVDSQGKPVFNKSVFDRQ
jgi:hypothetical protein